MPFRENQLGSEDESIGEDPLLKNKEIVDPNAENLEEAEKAKEFSFETNEKAAEELVDQIESEAKNAGINTKEKGWFNNSKAYIYTAIGSGALASFFAAGVISFQGMKFEGTAKLLNPEIKNVKGEKKEGALELQKNELRKIIQDLIKKLDENEQNLKDARAKREDVRKRANPREIGHSTEEQINDSEKSCQKLFEDGMRLYVQMLDAQHVLREIEKGKTID